jgi:hypothetical protein
MECTIFTTKEHEVIHKGTNALDIKLFSLVSLREILINPLRLNFVEAASVSPYY